MNRKVVWCFDRVRRAGFPVLVVTIDVLMVGNWENDLRACFSIPFRPGLRLTLDAARHRRWTVAALGRTLPAIHHGWRIIGTACAARYSVAR